jgi:hypothetical protein
MVFFYFFFKFKFKFFLGKIFDIKESFRIYGFKSYMKWWDCLILFCIGLIFRFLAIFLLFLNKKSSFFSKIFRDINGFTNVTFTSF